MLEPQTVEGVGDDELSQSTRDWQVYLNLDPKEAILTKWTQKVKGVVGLFRFEHEWNFATRDSIVDMPFIFGGF